MNMFQRGGPTTNQPLFVDHFPWDRVFIMPQPRRFSWMQRITWSVTLPWKLCLKVIQSASHSIRGFSNSSGISANCTKRYMPRRDMGEVNQLKAHIRYHPIIRSPRLLKSLDAEIFHPEFPPWGYHQDLHRSKEVSHLCVEQWCLGMHCSFSWEAREAEIFSESHPSPKEFSRYDEKRSLQPSFLSLFVFQN